MNKLKTKELQQALTNLFKLGVGKTNNNLTIVFGKTQTLLMVRRLDKFYETNNNGFIEFAAVLDADNQEQGLVLHSVARQESPRLQSWVELSD